MHRLDLVIFAFGNKCHWHRSDGIIVMRYGFAFDYAAGFRVGFSSVN